MLSKKSDTFGIDIGTTGVRVVQLNSQNGRPGLVAFAKAPLDPGIAQSDSPVDQDKVAGVIRELLKTAHITSNQAVTGIEASDAFATVITTPQLTPAELAKTMKLQAEQYIPMAVDQVKMDWHIIGPDPAGGMKVLLISAPNTIVNKYLALIEKAGLELAALEINPLAQVRSLIPPTGVSAVVLDVGNTNSDITIVHQSAPQLIRTVNVGRLTLVRSVSQALGLDNVQAEQFVQKFGLVQSKLEGQVAKAMKGSLDTLMSEVDKSIKFFLTRNADVKLEKIVLTGEAATMPEFPTYIANTAGMPVELGNPWINISYPASEQAALMDTALEYSVAAGLALRAFV